MLTTKTMFSLLHRGFQVAEMGKNKGENRISWLYLQLRKSYTEPETSSMVIYLSFDIYEIRIFTPGVL